MGSPFASRAISAPAGSLVLSWRTWRLGVTLFSRKGAKVAKCRVEGENGLSHSPPRHVQPDLQLSLTLFPLATPLAAWRDTFLKAAHHPAPSRGVGFSFPKPHPPLVSYR